MFISKVNSQDLTLLVVGDGPYRSELENMAKKIGIKSKLFLLE